MEQLILAFITGVTTGGLSCLAVQGGLLASSLANQIEQDLQRNAEAQSNKKNGGAHRGLKLHVAVPLTLFLLAKLVAYTILGALLGVIGSFFAFDPRAQAILLILIGIFLVGNALRMLQVHPIFRYFAIEPPKFITRFIRRKARDGADLATPTFLGALTVFIPCGVTQTMMAAALATGSPAMGAALMFAFILGTSPVFFIVAYLATELGARWEAIFMRLVAVVLLVLGILSVNNGLNLVGSPLALSNIARFLQASANPSVSSLSVSMQGAIAKELVTPAAGEASDPSQLTLAVVNAGYFPATLHAHANTAIRLTLLTDGTTSCARAFVIPDLSYRVLLPLTGQVTVDIPPQPAGKVMRFTCSMGMYTGQIIFDE
jgi:uncharacterized protein